MECLSICIYSRCIKKAQSLAEADPPLFLNNYLHTRTLACRDLYSGNRKRFCLATDTIKVLSSSGWTSARSPGHLQNTAQPQLIWHWRWMDGHVWVSDGRFVVEERGSWEMGDPCSVPPEGGQRPPLRTTAAPILTVLNKKGSLCTSGVWATQPAAGKRAPVPWALPSILASPLFLFLPAAVCSAMQNNVRQGPDLRPKPPWTNRFHLRPTYLDEALTNRVGIKLSPNNEVKRYRKRSPENRGRLELWSSAGNAGAIVLTECLDCTDTLECVRACGSVICIMVTRHSQRTCDALPFFFLEKRHRLNQPPCPDTFLSQGILGEESALSA